MTMMTRAKKELSKMEDFYGRRIHTEQLYNARSVRVWRLLFGPYETRRLRSVQQRVFVRRRREYLYAN